MAITIGKAKPQNISGVYKAKPGKVTVGKASSGGNISVGTNTGMQAGWNPIQTRSPYPRTHNPQTPQNGWVPMSYGSGGGGGGGGGGNVQGYSTGPSAAEIAAAQAAAEAARIKAEEDAKRNKLRGEGNSYIDQLMSLYEQIMGAIRQTGEDGSRRINKNYDGKVLEQHELMNDGMYQTDAANAAANLANSSWKAFDRGKVRKAKDANVSVLEEARGNDLGTIGRMVSEDTAKYQADKDGLGRTRSMLGETEDINELTGTVNTLDSSVRGTRAAQAKYGAQGDFVKKANSLGNYDTSTLEKTFQTIVANTSASPESKSAAMDDMLSKTPLNEDQKKQLKNKYQQVI